jgi:sterol 14-demethylase
MTAPPQLSGGFPWLGHAASFGRDPVTFLRKAHSELGEVLTFRLLGQEVTFLCGPSAHGAVFRASDDVLSPKEAYKFMTPVFGKGIAYDAAPKVMQEQLGLVLPSLTARRLQTYAIQMTREAETYLRQWDRSGVVSLPEIANEVTVAMTSRCLFGEQFRSQLTADFAKLYHDLESGIRLGAMIGPHLPLPAFRRRDRARRRITGFIREVMAQRRATGASEGEDFLSTLMNARYAGGNALADETIAGIILTLIFAGQHTSAVLASWTGVLLLENPGHLTALLSEQQAVFHGDPTISVTSLHRLSALERCIKEAERLHPPLTVLMRVATKPFSHNGFDISPGSLVMISPGVSHRLGGVFRDPDAYDPDRFGPGREEDRITPNALIGFGGGKHRCIGLAFAYQQVKVLWTMLLRHFDFELLSHQNRPDYRTLVAGPQRPCLIRYVRKARL